MKKVKQSVHEQWMQEALMEASFASSQGEIPIGAVAVANNEIIGRAHNEKEATKDPLGHAELILLKRVSMEHGNWRLDQVTVYVTCEPCLMCMGALLQARVAGLVFGCFEPKSGACGSLYNVSNDPRLNHRIKVVSGVLEEMCAAQLKQFFKAVRKKPDAINIEN